MDKTEKKQLRRAFSSLGIALVLYMIIMNLCVFGICILDVFVKALSIGVQDGFRIVYYRLPELIYDSLSNNAWGYLAAIVVGFLFLLLWKGKSFLFREIWAADRSMTFGSFLFLLVVFLSSQLLFMLLANIQEFLLNLFGFSAIYSLEAATSSADSFSMFLYASLLAPISEEILFRGLILRSLAPHGKRFAILLSAFLFGIFHGNLVQSPFAFLVGIVLGYTALEYNILWAMVLHMINNLVLSDMFYRIFAPNIADFVTNVLIILCAVAAVILCIVKRRRIVAYIRENPVDNKKIGLFFTSFGIILLIILMEITALTGITRI